jgi:hypothetical protein
MLRPINLRVALPSDGECLSTIQQSLPRPAYDRCSCSSPRVGKAPSLVAWRFVVVARKDGKLPFRMPTRVDMPPPAAFLALATYRTSARRRSSARLPAAGRSTTTTASKQLSTPGVPCDARRNIDVDRAMTPRSILRLMNSWLGRNDNHYFNQFVIGRQRCAQSGPRWRMSWRHPSIPDFVH